MIIKKYPPNESPWRRTKPVVSLTFNPSKVDYNPMPVTLSQPTINYNRKHFIWTLDVLFRLIAIYLQTAISHHDHIACMATRPFLLYPREVLPNISRRTEMLIATAATPMNVVDRGSSRGKQELIKASLRHQRGVVWLNSAGASVSSLFGCVPWSFGHQQRRTFWRR